MKRVLVVGLSLACFRCVAGCQSDDLRPFDYAVEIRRDAKVLLTTRPAALEESTTVDVEDR
jgi:hypothetical protein